jgi:hypothetical protein
VQISLIKEFEVKYNVVEKIMAPCSTMLLMGASPTFNSNHFNDCITFEIYGKCVNVKSKRRRIFQVISFSFNNQKYIHPFMILGKYVYSQCY